MTEDEWFTSNSLSELLKHLKPIASVRKMKLFLMECCLQNIELYEENNLVSFIQHADDCVEGRMQESERLKIEDKAYVAAYRKEEKYGDCGQFLFAPAKLLAKQFDTDDADQLSWYIRQRSGSGGIGWDLQRYDDWLELDHIEYIRDQFGNPFRPVAFSPAWRDSNSVPIAQAMYASRDFTAAPILADALEDAGCTEAAILDHLRDPGNVHVRGCWAIDLVLGKS